MSNLGLQPKFCCCHFLAFGPIFLYSDCIPSYTDCISIFFYWIVYSVYTPKFSFSSTCTNLDLYVISYDHISVYKQHYQPLSKLLETCKLISATYLLFSTCSSVLRGLDDSRIMVRAFVVQTKDATRKRESQNGLERSSCIERNEIGKVSDGKNTLRSLQHSQNT